MIGTIRKADVLTEWYKYEDKEWANAVTVNTDAYREAEAGTIIPMVYIEEMYVWIPRYAYDADTIIDAQHAIDIIFVDKETEAHPAFTVGTTELRGMWVGKFEATQSLIFDDGDLSFGEHVVKPDAIAYSEYEFDELFNLISEFNLTNSLDYTTDVHMIKNTEWGCVAYFSQSIYGVCNDVDDCEKIENNNFFLGDASLTATGCGGNDVAVGITIFDEAELLAGKNVVCPDENKWTTENGMHASTTRNITGVYDMAGGAPELVAGSMSYYDVPLPISIYADSYKYGDDIDGFDRGIVGDAIIELNPLLKDSEKWNGDSFEFINGEDVYFYRGGAAGISAITSDDSSSGIWSFMCINYYTSGFFSRPVAWTYENFSEIQSENLHARPLLYLHKPEK